MQYFCPISEYQQKMSNKTGQILAQNRISELPAVIQTAVAQLAELAGVEITKDQKSLIREQLVNNFLNTLLISAQFGIDLESLLERLCVELDSI